MTWKKFRFGRQSLECGHVEFGRFRKGTNLFVHISKQIAELQFDNIQLEVKIGHIREYRRFWMIINIVHLTYPLL
jgi:hypothetical protein